MLSRSSAVIISLTSLCTGIVLGLLLGRGGPPVAAQVSGASRAQAGARETSQGRAANALDQRQVDDATYDALAQQYSQFEQVNRTFELVAKAVSPAVVHIVAQKTSRSENSRRPRHVEETGSGVIIRSDRAPGLYVMTNHHVVDGAAAGDIKVFLRDGRAILPVKVWNDAKADIAVLHLDRDDLPAARLGDSNQAKVGTWVMALGSPFGLMHSVSQGIISARGRHMEELPDVENQDFLQTDAAINPGNSGGPLVNMSGEVIGINNSIASNGGGNEGVGFSIPINLARWIMNELIAHGRVTRGALGVDLDGKFGPDRALELGMDRPRGAKIDTVYRASPAAQAGLRGGDVVLRFAGVDVIDLNHLINMVSMAAVGESAEIVIWRDRREHRLLVTVGERERTLAPLVATPAEPAHDPSGLLRRPNRPRAGSSFVMGMELATLNAQIARSIDIAESFRGALVLSIEPKSPLAGDVKPHDVISSIDGQAIQSAEQAVRILNQRNEHLPLVMSLYRPAGGGMEPYTVRVPR